MTTEENKTYARRLRDAIETVIGTKNTVYPVANAAARFGRWDMIEATELQIERTEKNAREQIWQLMHGGAGRDIGT
jgi:hypothetical protein